MNEQSPCHPPKVLISMNPGDLRRNIPDIHVIEWSGVPEYLRSQIFVAATTTAIQPTMKATPPIGVIAPSHFMPVNVMR